MIKQKSQHLKIFLNFDYVTMTFHFFAWKEKKTAYHKTFEVLPSSKKMVSRYSSFSWTSPFSTTLTTVVSPKFAEHSFLRMNTWPSHHFLFARCSTSFILTVALLHFNFRDSVPRTGSHLDFTFSPAASTTLRNSSSSCRERMPPVWVRKRVSSFSITELTIKKVSLCSRNKARLAADLAIAKNKNLKKSTRAKLMVEKSKMKLRTSKYLYTIVLDTAKVAQIKKTLPKSTPFSF